MNKEKLSEFLYIVWINKKFQMCPNHNLRFSCLNHVHFRQSKDHNSIQIYTWNTKNKQNDQEYYSSSSIIFIHIYEKTYNWVMRPVVVSHVTISGFQVQGEMSEV